MKEGKGRDRKGMMEGWREGKTRGLTKKQARTGGSVGGNEKNLGVCYQEQLTDFRHSGGSGRA